MSIGQPTKSIESDDELGRAILDDRMEAFKPQINANLAGFSNHKDRLLSLLFHDYNRLRTSDTHKNAWSRIETTAYKYFARQILTRTTADPADEVARYRAMSDASKHARNKLEDVRWRDIARKPLKRWLEGNVELAEATEEFSDRLYMEVNLGGILDQAIESLAELELAANRAADKVHRRRGRPEGTSILPRNYISILEKIYEESTGQIASLEADRCREFVEAFLVGVGNSDETSKDYVAERIKYERKRTRKLSASSRPSTNDGSRE